MVDAVLETPAEVDFWSVTQKMRLGGVVRASRRKMSWRR
jgi:hypothetical protein